jgi:glutamate N-acetyltransferase / amino-acid N-acetyltransferase
MTACNSIVDYEDVLKTRSTLPRGFRAGSVGMTFHPRELPGDKLYPMNLSLIELIDATDSAAGVFTRNAFPGAPVLLCRERLEGSQIKGVLINNKVANVCAPGGYEDACRVTESLAEAAGGGPEQWLYASTGVIGWKLPVQEICTALPDLTHCLQADSVLTAAKGIMTTDRYPKIRSARVGDVTIVGIAKGAGMIEPDMATMLAFIMTDADLSRHDLSRALHEAAEDSFNVISVDGDQSTSDMAILLSSRMASAPDYSDFIAALRQVCGDLARDIVRNGEGTAHVIEVSVSGARNGREARGVAKAVVNSPLVKTAIYGNDPNIGRLVSSLGDYAGNMDIPLNRQALTICLGDELIFASGEFRISPEIETRLSAYLEKKSFSPELKGYPEHDETVQIEIDLQNGTGFARVWGSDLSYEYIRENAEYRS